MDDKILEFTVNKAVDDYINDRAFRSAVERELQIIGEALIGLEKVEPAVAAQIPEYQNPMTIWNVVETKLESLAQKIKSLLKGYE
ncbi:MAG: hypothetical protein ABIL62_09475 [Planctomycetota bacterium]